MVCISVIINFPHYKLQILNGPQSSIVMFSPKLEPSIVENEWTLKILNDKFSQCCDISVCVGYCDCKITNEEDLAKLSLLYTYTKSWTSKLVLLSAFKRHALNTSFIILIMLRDRLLWHVHFCTKNHIVLAMQGSKGKRKAVSISVRRFSIRLIILTLQ